MHKSSDSSDIPPKSRVLHGYCRIDIPAHIRKKMYLSLGVLARATDYMGYMGSVGLDRL